jgi:quinohemoprotein ethanol dehydrogenase
MLRSLATLCIICSLTACAPEKATITQVQHPEFYSTLNSINVQNVKQLGFAWSYDLGTHDRVSATAIVADGRLFATGPWGKVHAVDAASGRELWVYDPPRVGQWGRYTCCGFVNRGAAYAGGRVYAGATDGFLHALDAVTGKLLWRVDTLTAEDRQAHRPYTITGAPRIAGDVVVIGNGGADMGNGARGYVTARDLSTGAERWRFYTVPRDPKKGPQDQAHLVDALKTWDINGDWAEGGGGSVWDGMNYDAELGLLYIGVGNGAPWNARERSPAGGDNLYLSSIVAIDAASGQYRWHFQTVPGDHWDYTATAKIIFADLMIQGRQRKVLMQAPKNGFFYVLDRQTGEFLSGDALVNVSWTLGLDPKTGRPEMNPAADWHQAPRLVAPGPGGAHTWDPISFNPQSGLVYLTMRESQDVFVNTRNRPIGRLSDAFYSNAFASDDYDPVELKSLYGELPTLEQLAKDSGFSSRPRRNMLKAWDPVARRLAWELADVEWAGVLSTAGGLITYGDQDGFLNFIDAKNGTRLHRIKIDPDMRAAPMTYSLGGEQYIAVLAGDEQSRPARVVALKLGGAAAVPPAGPAIPERPLLAPAKVTAAAAQLQAGERTFFSQCARCHGGGVIPDLRRSVTYLDELNFRAIVLEGKLQPRGMGRFDDILSDDDVTNLRQYLLSEAHQLFKEEQR